MPNESTHNQIHWFPGHMMKAIKAIETKLPIIDVAIEVLDARAPLATKSTLLDRLLEKKIRIIVLNKVDLADDNFTKEWVNFFESQGFSVLLAKSLTTKMKPQLLNLITKLMEPQMEKQLAKGIVNPKIKVLIMGLPNTGKSTFINNLLQRKVTQTANIPGVTRGQQWIKLNPTIDLLDSPGILPPKMNDQKVVMILALIKAIPVKHLFLEEIANFALTFLLENYYERLVKYYNINFEIKNINDETLFLYFKKLAQKYHLKLANDEDNTHRAMNLFINDLQVGKLGLISFEIPPKILKHEK
ncbi:ribosome biogenesis GTPase YlqF [Spiroplasma endosymbiont of Apeira syringaria]|uniref:ribosome biogenesis GTPase YlqF n=1 Tax=Spiroplasma endosymbiont of Apeira syringaria TaxID=3066307 RepID=UPI0030CD06C0